MQFAYNPRYLPQAHDKLVIPERQLLMTVTLNIQAQVYTLDMNYIPAESCKCQVAGYFLATFCVGV